MPMVDAQEFSDLMSETIRAILVEDRDLHLTIDGQEVAARVTHSPRVLSALERLKDANRTSAVLRAVVEHCKPPEHDHLPVQCPICDVFLPFVVGFTTSMVDGYNRNGHCGAPS